MQSKLLRLRPSTSTAPFRACHTDSPAHPSIWHGRVVCRRTCRETTPGVVGCNRAVHQQRSQRLVGSSKPGKSFGTMCRGAVPCFGFKHTRHQILFGGIWRTFRPRKLSRSFQIRICASATGPDLHALLRAPCQYRRGGEECSVPPRARTVVTWKLRIESSSLPVQSYKQSQQPDGCGDWKIVKQFLHC